MHLQWASLSSRKENLSSFLTSSKMKAPGLPLRPIDFASHSAREFYGEYCHRLCLKQPPSKDTRSALLDQTRHRLLWSKLRRRRTKIYPTQYFFYLEYARLVAELHEARPIDYYPVRLCSLLHRLASNVAQLCCGHERTENRCRPCCESRCFHHGLRNSAVFVLGRGWLFLMSVTICQNHSH